MSDSVLEVTGWSVGISGHRAYLVRVFDQFALNIALMLSDGGVRRQCAARSFPALLTYSIDVVLTVPSI